MPFRMLIVDDEERILAAVSAYFEHLEYAVDCAHTLDEAQGLLDSRHYDVILADLRLSGIDCAEGLEIVSLARRRHPSPRVVLLSAYGTPEVVQEADKRGVDAFLHKPQPLAEVARIVSDLLRAAPAVC